jgi:hypothetical protein
MAKIMIIGCCFLFGMKGLILGYLGHSEPYRQFLNQPKPTWLNLGEPVIADVCNESAIRNIISNKDDDIVEVTQHEIRLPKKGIKINFGEYSIIDWSSSDNPRNKYLSPDGTKLIVNLGTYHHIYRILDQGKYEETKLDYPLLTFDMKRRGIISDWRWGTDEVLIGDASIENPETGKEEGRYIYIYYLEEKILSRLDIQGLSSESAKSINIEDVNRDKEGNAFIKIRCDGKEMILQANLMRRPRIIEPAMNIANDSNDREKLQDRRVDMPVENEEKEDRVEINHDQGLGVKILIITGIVLAIITGLVFYRRRRG